MFLLYVRPDRIPIPSLLTLGALHQHLLKTKQVANHFSIIIVSLLILFCDLASESSHFRGMW